MKKGQGLETNFHPLIRFEVKRGKIKVNKIKYAIVGIPRHLLFSLGL